MAFNRILLLGGIIRFFLDNHVKPVQNIAEQFIDVNILQIELHGPGVHPRQT